MEKFAVAFSTKAYRTVSSNAHYSRPYVSNCVAHRFDAPSGSLPFIRIAASHENQLRLRDCAELNDVDLVSGSAHKTFTEIPIKPARAAQF
jgi:hypothetical protein